MARACAILSVEVDMATFEILVRENEDIRVFPDYHSREAALDDAKAMAHARAKAIGGTVDVMYGEQFGWVVSTPYGQDSSYWVWWNPKG